jgi:hypothetical protein
VEESKEESGNTKKKSRKVAVASNQPAKDSTLAKMEGRAN